MGCSTLQRHCARRPRHGHRIRPRRELNSRDDRRRDRCCRPSAQRRCVGWAVERRAVPVAVRDRRSDGTDRRGDSSRRCNRQRRADCCHPDVRRSPPWNRPRRCRACDQSSRRAPLAFSGWRCASPARAVGPGGCACTIQRSSFHSREENCLRACGWVPRHPQTIAARAALSCAVRGRRGRSDCFARCPRRALPVGPRRRGRRYAARI